MSCRPSPVLGRAMEKQLGAPGFCSASSVMCRPNMAARLRRNPDWSPSCAQKP